MTLGLEVRCSIQLSYKRFTLHTIHTRTHLNHIEKCVSNVREEGDCEK